MSSSATAPSAAPSGQKAVLQAERRRACVVAPVPLAFSKCPCPRENGGALRRGGSCDASARDGARHRTEPGGRGRPRTARGARRRFLRQEPLCEAGGVPGRAGPGRAGPGRTRAPRGRGVWRRSAWAKRDGRILGWGERSYIE